MMKKHVIPYMVLLLIIVAFFSIQEDIANAAAEKPPSLLITEVMVNSPDSEDAYRYIELYNNTARSINLADMKIYYYWQATTSAPWANSSATGYEITSAGRANDMYIQPYSTKVVWLLSDPSKTVHNFNTIYGTNLDDTDFVYLESSSG